MPAQINFGRYLLPLLVVRLNQHGAASLLRYAGVAFYLQSDGLLATCKHIIESIGPGETLVAKNLQTGAMEMLLDIRVHAKADFALCRTMAPTPHDYFRHLLTPVQLGAGVQALGFTAAGAEGKNLVVDARLFKGYVSRLSQNASRPDAISTLELSFPSLRGFSGAPVIGAQEQLIGMLFSNHESTIELFKYEEVDDEKSRYRESVHRVQEFGLVQPVADIRQFSAELGVALQ